MGGNLRTACHSLEVMVSPTFLYVIMEYLDGPDLSDWMLSAEASWKSSAGRRVSYGLNSLKGGIGVI